MGCEKDTISRGIRPISKALRENLMEPPVDVVDHLGNIVFTWNGNDAFAGDEAG